MKTFRILWTLYILAFGSSYAAGDEPRYSIMPGSAASKLLAQCSRAAPAMGEATWPPTAGDVAKMESVLPQIVSRFQAGDRRPISDWYGQYVGIVRDGKRFLYGNFFVASAQLRQIFGDLSAHPVVLCDGGPTNFGLEMNEVGYLTAENFNGR